ncbi:MAG: hypothetical protein ACHBN1_35680 [Heteroscytonema crispum UTEX LB 1556]
MKSFALLLPGRATPVAKAAGKPFQQVLQVGEACTAVAHGGNPQDRAASPTHCFTNALA